MVVSFHEQPSLYTVALAFVIHICKIHVLCFIVAFLCPYYRAHSFTNRERVAQLRLYISTAANLVNAMIAK